MAVLKVAAAAVAVASLGALGVHLTAPEPAAVEATRDVASWTGERVRVEVFNAGGLSGMAREATGMLRDSGFDVVTFGNAGTFDPERPSEVIDRVGRTDIAGAVATVLEIDRVQSQPDPNLFVDVTVVVGRDWAAPSRSSVALGETERAWWDPRRWIEKRTTNAADAAAER